MSEPATDAQIAAHEAVPDDPNISTTPAFTKALIARIAADRMGIAALRGGLNSMTYSYDVAIRDRDSAEKRAEGRLHELETNIDSQSGIIADLSARNLADAPLVAFARDVLRYELAAIDDEAEPSAYTALFEQYGFAECVPNDEDGEPEWIFTDAMREAARKEGE